MTGGRSRRSLAELDLNLLVALDALLRERSVTRAGQRLGVSQPTMSTSLRRLRRFFDDELLSRAGRDYELTPIGRELAAPVAEILALIERTIDGPAPFDPTKAERTFVVLASDYIQLILQPVVAQLAREAPGIRLRFESPDARMVRRLQNREVDLAVRSQLGGRLRSQTLLHDRWVCAVANDHPDIRTRLTKKQFLSCPHVAFRVGRAGSMAEDFLVASGIDRDVQFTTDGFIASLFLLRGTRLIAIVQERLGQLLADAAGVALHPSPIPIPDLVSNLWWHPVNTADPAHAWLRTALASAVE